MLGKEGTLLTPEPRICRGWGKFLEVPDFTSLWYGMGLWLRLESIFKDTVLLHSRGWSQILSPVSALEMPVLQAYTFTPSSLPPSPCFEDHFGALLHIRKASYS